MNKKISTPIVIGIILILAIIVGGFTWWQYGEIRKEESNVPEVQIPEKKEILSGILLSSCSWEDNKCFVKAGPAFELCEWDYLVKTFKEVGKYPDCIWLDVWPYQNEQVLKYRNYLNKKVKITGTIESIKYGSKDENCELTQIGCERDTIILKPEKIEEILEDETADWQTYRNEEYGFEMKYPSDWKTASEFPGRLGPGQTEFIEGVNPQSFLFAPNSKDLTKSEADVILYVAPEGWNCSTYTNLSNDSVNDFLKQNLANNEIEFCKSNIYFRFSVTTPQKEIFNQMLSTFKFIYEDETADWENYTYTDSILGFSFKYPSEWSTPQQYILSTKREIDFGTNLQISTGIYYNQDLGRNMTIEELINAAKNYKNFKQEKITVARAEAIKISYTSPVDNKNIIEVYLSHNDNIIIITSGSNNEAQFNKIISTFKFLKEVSGLNCEENSKYFVIYKEEFINDSFEQSFLVKYKTDSKQNIPCSYVVDKEDFEIKDQFFTWFLALTDNFLILDMGTGPWPRTFIVYNLNSRKEVYTDSYSTPMSILNDVITYWNPINQKVTNENCPELSKYSAMGLGTGIETHVSLDIFNLIKKELGEYRCSARQ